MSIAQQPCYVSLLNTSMALGTFFNNFHLEEGNVLRSLVKFQLCVWFFVSLIVRENKISRGRFLTLGHDSDKKYGHNPIPYGGDNIPPCLKSWKMVG